MYLFMKKLLTLCIVHQDQKVLLGMKKRGFGEGRWNGFGGKVQEGETIEQAAKRELEEEAGIASDSLERRGIIEFEFKGDPQILEVHIFYVSAFQGTIAESEEMKPQWFLADEIPFHEMWPDDKFWFPLFLAGETFRGTFLFDGMDTIARHELFKVQRL